MISDVVLVDSVKRNDLFIRAQKWFSEIFIDSARVLEITDKEAGVLTGKAGFCYEESYWGSELITGSIIFTISIYVKDGEYKYEIGNFNHLKTFGVLTSSDTYRYKNNTIASNKWMDKSWRKVKKIATQKAERLAASLFNRMTSISKHEEDW
jgi:hypothetical protein